MRFLLDLLFPPRCVLCHGFLPNSKNSTCDVCAKKVLTHPTVFTRGKHFSKCVSPLEYHGVVRESIHRFKFSECQFYAGAYAPWLASVISRELEEPDLMTWVPISRKRKKTRGYDQGELLCRETAGLIDAEVMQLLRKTGNNTPQSGLLEAKERKENVRGMYAPLNSEYISGKRILLIDDVITTGSTLEECSCVLRKAGAKEVVCATVATTK